MDRFVCDGCGAGRGDYQPVGRCMDCNSDFYRENDARPQRNQPAREFEDWRDDYHPDVRSELEGKYVYGIDSGKSCEMPAGKFEISVMPQRSHRLERFMLSETMCEAFELLSVEVGDDKIHHLVRLEIRRNKPPRLWLLEPVDVLGGSTVKLHVLAQRSGKRFTVTAIGGAAELS